MKTESTNEHDSDEIKAKISSKIFVYIKSIEKNTPVGGPLYAINWFDTKSLWLYNFYNLVATRSVTRIGGTPYFKGKVQDVLFGDTKHRRDVLLIVKYPNALQFKKLIESFYFKCVSIFRMLSVTRFTFGFTKPTGPNPVSAEATLSAASQNKVYTVHHYKADSDITKDIEQAVAAQKVEIHYAGAIKALLYSGDAKVANNQTPCIMSGIVILSATSLTDHKNLIQSEAYQAIIKKSQSSFIATLKRIL